MSQSFRKETWVNEKTAAKNPKQFDTWIAHVINLAVGEL